MSPKHSLAILIGGRHSEDGANEDGQDDKHEIAKTVLDAVKADDAEALADALTSFFDCCEADEDDKDDEHDDEE